MQGDVEAGPGLPDLLEDGLKLTLLLDIQRQEDWGFEIPGQGFDERASLVVEVLD